MGPSCCSWGRALALALALAVQLVVVAADDAAQETFDPDVDLNTPQTIRRYGYAAEAHVVETADGYLLTVHRIPGPRLSNFSEGPAPSAPASAAASPSDGTTAAPSPSGTTASDAPPHAYATDAGTTPSGKTAQTTDAADGPWPTTAPPAGVEATSTTTERPVTADTSGNGRPSTTAWTNPSGTNATSDPSSTPLPPTLTPATSPEPPSSSTHLAPGYSTKPSTIAPQPAPTTSSTSTVTTPNTPTPATTTTTSLSTTETPSNTTSPANTSIKTISTTTQATSTIPTTTTTTTQATTTTQDTTSTTPISTTIPPHPSPTTTTTTTSPPTSRPVIFLQHGLLGSSYDWIVAGPDKGLAYLLADAGYDVWMGNARGNTYSRAHVYLPTESSSPFWDFSFHEMGIYDLPAVIDYILNTTGAQQLHYVGHSMGTTMFFVMASTKPEAAAGVASMHALAPVVYVKHIKSPIRLLAPFARDVEFLAGLLGDGEFLPQNKILHYLAKYGCELLETEKDVCENLIFILCGYDKPQFNTSILPVLLSHTPAGASTRTLIHYAQMIKSGKFQQYDLGKYGNLKKYRSLEPPTYDLSKVNVSIHLVYANNDWLAAPVDVNTLYQDLHCTKTKYVVPLSSFNHLDFILAKDVKTLLYDKLLKEIPRDIDYQNYEDNFLYD